MRTLSGMLMAVVLLSAGSARAEEIYRWTDEEGEVHYTNDPDSIPQGQKKKAKKTKGADLGSLPTREQSPSPPTVRPPEASADSQAAQGGAGDEAYWRSSFRALRDKVAVLEKELEVDRKILADPAASGMSVEIDMYGRARPNREFENTRRRVTLKEAELTRAREELSELERRAAHKAIPLEWRR